MSGNAANGRQTSRYLIVIGLVLIVAAAVIAAVMLFQKPDKTVAANDPVAKLVSNSKVIAVTQKPLDTATRVSVQWQNSPEKLAFPAALVGKTVTKAPLATGDQVTAFSAITEVDGQPIIAVPSAVPFNRDLTNGLTGDDVRAFQDALKAAGVPVPDNELGTFGLFTQSYAVKYYKELGYQLPTSVATVDGRQQEVAFVPSTSLLAFKTLPTAVGQLPGVGTVLTAENAAAEISGGASNSLKILTNNGSVVTPGSTLQMSKDGIALDFKVNTATVADGVSIVTVDPDPAAPTQWSGQTMDAQSVSTTFGPETLVVPNAAVIHSGTASAVVKQDGSGKRQTIEVKVLGTSGDESAIAPITAGQVKAGDSILEALS